MIVMMVVFISALISSPQSSRQLSSDMKIAV